MQPIASASSAPSQIEARSQTASQATAMDAVHRAKAPAPSGRIESVEAEVRKAIDAANAALKQVTNDLEFAVDSTTGKTVVRLIDADTRQVIRQFPSDEMLAIARALDRFQGLLIEQKA